MAFRTRSTEKSLYHVTDKPSEPDLANEFYRGGDFV
jgi:hypothetical protein